MGLPVGLAVPESCWSAGVLGGGSGSGPGLATTITLCPVASGAGNGVGRMWHFLDCCVDNLQR